MFFSKNDKSSNGAKHMELKYLTIKEEFHKQQVSIEHINTQPVSIEHINILLLF